MKVLVTGASGFLGSALVRHLRAEPVHYRSPAPLRADVIIHCGHDFSEGAMARNLALAEALANAPRVVYLSSCSAVAGARSEYGRTKYAVERLMLASGHTVVRPGLVVGAGGLFLRGAQAIRRARLVPLVDGGRLRLPVVALADLVESFPVILHSNQQEWNLFLPELVEQREYVRIINPAARIVPVPRWLAMAGLGAAQSLGMRLPVNRENLLGILDSQDLLSTTAFTSHLLQVVPEPLPLAVMVREALGA